VCAAQDALSWREAVRRALTSHPALESAGGRIAATEGFRAQAGLKPNPRLFFQTENTRFGGRSPFSYADDTDNFAYLQNSFETAGKRHRRVDLANQIVLRTELERELLRKQIAGRVSAAYWNAAGASRMHTLLKETAANFAGIVNYHEVRVREGSMPEGDLIRVRLEAQRLNVDINHAFLDAERSRILLFRDMGQTEFPAVRFSDTVESALDDSPAMGLDAALAQRTEIRIARQALEEARASQRLQQVAAKPNLDVLFGYKRTAGLNTIIGGVQVDVPLFNRNQGNIAAAAAGIRVAESNLAAAQAIVRAEVRAAISDYRILREEIEGILKPLLNHAAETYRIAEGAYRLGGSDLLRLLDAQRVRLESRIAFLRGLTEVRQSQAALETAMGVEP
jgi:cobalt-zinc-cadmium efflux system outer membrane protein